MTRPEEPSDRKAIADMNDEEFEGFLRDALRADLTQEWPHMSAEEAYAKFLERAGLHPPDTTD